MSERNQTNKHAYLSRLSTKELEVILRADAESPNTDHDEAISYILEVIEQREHERPSDSFPDVDISWKEFQIIYNTPEGINQVLYPNGEYEDPHVLFTHLSKKRRRRLRRSILIAAIIVLLFVSLTIPAAGYGNLLEMIGSWTANQFTFITTGQRSDSQPEGTNASTMNCADSSVGSELRQVLLEHGISVDVVPKWMPDGFKLSGDISVLEYPDFDRIEFFSFYESDEDSCSLSIAQISNSTHGSIYEKDVESPEVYVFDNIEHYIVKNSDSIIVAWHIDDLECSINTTMSESELKRVIDSIYEGVVNQ